MKQRRVKRERGSTRRQGARLGAAFGLAGLCLAAAGCLPEYPALRAPAHSGADDGPLPDMLVDGPLPDMPGDGPPPDMPDEGPPPVEVCNGVDDDRDGEVDEGFQIGTSCELGQGPCRAEGVFRCAEDRLRAECDARPGRPEQELCNGIDDDCSGVIDEGFEAVGERCAAGLGACEAFGEQACAPDQRSVVCDARPDEAARSPERCNGIDDDCDGVVDNGLVRSCDTEQTGVCRPGRSTCAEGVWGPCLGDVEPGARRDACNGLDDDCDGRVDQESLPLGPQACLCEDAMDVIVDGCVPAGGCLTQCANDDQVVCAPAPEDACDGRDEDCDGVTDDDAVCGGPLVETCTLGLGWTTREVPSPTDDWAGCDPTVGGFEDTVSCNGSLRGIFATVGIPQGADLDAAGHRLGVSLRCRPGAVGDYIVSQCRVILAVARDDAGALDGAGAWGPCPAERVGGDDRIACTSNTADGAFLPMPVPFDLGPDSLVGVAFVCTDADDPARAAALQASVALELAWADGSLPGEIDWDAACRPLGDGDPATACASTRGDARFRLFRPAYDVDGGDRFAFRLRPIQ